MVSQAFSTTRLENWISRHVRFVLSSPKTVLLVGPDLDRVVDGVVVRLCGRPRRLVCGGGHWCVALLVDTIPVVLSVLRRQRGHLRRLLDGVLAASLGGLVDPGVGADPVHVVLSGSGQRCAQ